MRASDGCRRCRECVPVPSGIVRLDNVFPLTVTVLRGTPGNCLRNRVGTVIVALVNSSQAYEFRVSSSLLGLFKSQLGNIGLGGSTHRARGSRDRKIETRYVHQSGVIGRTCWQTEGLLEISRDASGWLAVPSALLLLVRPLAAGSVGVCTVRILGWHSLPLPHYSRGKPPPRYFLCFVASLPLFNTTFIQSPSPSASFAHHHVSVCRLFLSTNLVQFRQQVLRFALVLAVHSFDN